MKRAIVLLLLFLLLIIFPLTSALELNMDTEIDKGETVIASFSGNFIDPPSREDIHFYRGHTETSFEYDLAKIDNLYYIYFKTTGKSQNNYSINITGVKYIGDEGTATEEQISKNFKITNKTADFSFSPGFFIVDDDFYIKLQNLKPFNLNVNIKSEFSSGSNKGELTYFYNNQEIADEFTLSPSITRNLYIKTENLPNTTVRIITLSTDNYEYSFPAYISRKIITPPEKNESENKSEEDEVIKENEEGENIIDDEEINLSENCTFFQALFGKCVLNKTNSTASYNSTKNVSKNSSSNSSLDYEVIKKGNKTVVIKNGEIINQTGTIKTCSEIKGKICASDQVCKNQTIYAKDAPCCISECVKKAAPKNRKALGWIIIIFIIFMILWFFLKKFKGTSIKKDPLLK